MSASWRLWPASPSHGPPTLYTTVPQTALLDLGSSTYQMFDHAVVLDQVMRQSREDPMQPGSLSQNAAMAEGWSNNSG